MELWVGAEHLPVSVSVSVVGPNLLGVNRTDRLYAIVEDLRAIAPRTRSARHLAAKYEVSIRTIERDLSALQQAGVPIYAETGRTGGYGLDKAMTLPPLNFTPAEAVAVAVALHSADGSPLHRAARSALRKIIAAMPAAQVPAAAELADRVRFLFPADGTDSDGFAMSTPDPVPLRAAVEEAVVRRRVLRLVYRDKQGEISEREVEPTTFVAGRQGWYIAGWCRLRAEVRVFRLDRILDATDTGEQAPARSQLRADAAYAPLYVAQSVTLA